MPKGPSGINNSPAQNEPRSASSVSDDELGSTSEKVFKIFPSAETEENFNQFMSKQNQLKAREQIAAAQRSLITNLLVAIVIILTLSIMVILPKPVNVFWIVMASTCEKGLLPILTTIANFKTIQSVVPQQPFLNHF